MAKAEEFVAIDLARHEDAPVDGIAFGLEPGDGTHAGGAIDFGEARDGKIIDVGAGSGEADGASDLPVGLPVGRSVLSVGNPGGVIGVDGIRGVAIELVESDEFGPGLNH